eukprot:scaffold69524_cov19-Prasinocladus_malaysianus.AAC.1
MLENSSITQGNGREHLRGCQSDDEGREADESCGVAPVAGLWMSEQSLGDAGTNALGYFGGVFSPTGGLCWPVECN